MICSIVLEIVSFVCLPKYGGLFSMMRTLQFYPYFLMGYCMKQRPDLLENNRKWFVVGGLASVVFISRFAGRLLHLCEYQTYSLREMLPHSDFSVFGLVAFRYGYIVASLFIGGLILWGVNRSRWVQKFAAWGQGTLFVYYGHIFLFALVCKLQPSLTESLLWAAAVVVLLSYVSKKSFSRILMNPVSTLLKNMKIF
ncbi:MAG: hypothetical protein J6K95_07205 [Rikenellaceae bacterium]|nr:hypothetical protein [Rikenellaceae bacterium]